MRPCVIRNQAKAGFVNIPRLESEVQRVVTARAFASAHVNGRILLVWAGKARGSWVRRRVETDVAGAGARVASDQGLVQVGLATSDLIDVIQVVEMNSMRAAV